jgi:hypothetical protein
MASKYAAMVQKPEGDWEAWNGTMLPEHARPVPYVNTGNFVADHYGVTNPPPAAPPSGLPTKS